MDVIVRSYETGDLEACRKLWKLLTIHHREIYDDGTIGGDNPGIHFDEHLAKVGARRIWVAVCGASICGMAGLIVTGDEGEIEPVIVCPEQRQAGIGKMLLERATAEARKNNVRFLSVAPVARNRRAIEFFLREGFGTVGRIELFTELTPSTRKWSQGVTVHGMKLKQ